MTTLCEQCFPRWAHVEVLTMPALVSCAGCGTRQRLHVFRRDPRALSTTTYGIPLPEAKQCKAVVWRADFKETVGATCIYETAGPRFVGQAQQGYSTALNLRDFELSLVERRLKQEALSDVQRQVVAHNAVILPIPND